MPSAAKTGSPIRICFVCSGNICRSPTAEVVFAELVRRAGRAAEFVVDSAGIGGWHVGAGIDERARAALANGGYPAHRHVARQFVVTDFDSRHLVVAMDRGHETALRRLAEQSSDPETAGDSIALLRAYDESAVLADDLEVPDPYYGGPDGFRTVLAEIEAACSGLLTSLSPH
jgi:protein-tyrosine phosphatase